MWENHNCRTWLSQFELVPQSVRLLDNQGQQVNGEQASLLADGDGSTTWEASEQAESAVLILGDFYDLSEVAIEWPGSKNEPLPMGEVDDQVCEGPYIVNEATFNRESCLAGCRDHLTCFVGYYPASGWCKVATTCAKMVTDEGWQIEKFVKRTTWEELEDTRCGSGPQCVYPAPMPNSNEDLESCKLSCYVQPLCQGFTLDAGGTCIFHQETKCGVESGTGTTCYSIQGKETIYNDVQFNYTVSARLSEAMGWMSLGDASLKDGLSHSFKLNSVRATQIRLTLPPGKKTAELRVYGLPTPDDETGIPGFELCKMVELYVKTDLQKSIELCQ